MKSYSVNKQPDGKYDVTVDGVQIDGLTSCKLEVNVGDLDLLHITLVANGRRSFTGNGCSDEEVPPTKGELEQRVINLLEGPILRNAVHYRDEAERGGAPEFLISLIDEELDCALFKLSDKQLSGANVPKLMSALRMADSHIRYARDMAHRYIHPSHAAWRTLKSFNEWREKQVSDNNSQV